MKKYTFTEGQLSELLKSALEIYLEYCTVPGKNHLVGLSCATEEILQRLDAEMELRDNGEITSLKLQSDQ